MILPSRKLRYENSLIYVGGKILGLLDEPQTVSGVWEEFKHQRSTGLTSDAPYITFDWFVLALDLLFAISVLGLSEGRLYKTRS